MVTNQVRVTKNENNQEPVSTQWRKPIEEIIAMFEAGSFNYRSGIDRVLPIPSEDSKRIQENIKAYGATLTKLPTESWTTSVCQWMCGYWGVLVDLYTKEEGASDLVLSMRVTEEGESYTFEVQSVYVP